MIYKGLCCFLIIFSSLAFISCNSTSPKEITTPEPSSLGGKELAELHCGGCHTFPEPSLLPKYVWRTTVLPEMSLRFGHGDYAGKMKHYSKEEVEALVNSEIFPKNKTIATEDWQKIVKYYSDEAPHKLEKANKLVTGDLNTFLPENIAIAKEGITVSQIEEHTGKVFLGTKKNKNLQLDFSETQSKVLKSFASKSPIVKVLHHKKYGKVQLEIGDLQPTELANGSLVSEGKVLIANLHRPVDMVLADINEDGVEDFIIANFGNYTGNLSWYDGNTLKQTVLWNEPGARVVYFTDFDKDGKKDILVLFTQGREAIVMLKNEGRGSFLPKNLISFPPVYGSSYFVVKDFDKDGDDDLVYTNGDNADYSILNKPYHGLRLFSNNGDFNFTEDYFYPINGASKVIAEDFDKDGDVDMAVISFFPDKKTNEGFLYFKQTGEKSFDVKSLENIETKKWLTMDSGDINMDGYTDLILGSLNYVTESDVMDNSAVILWNTQR